MKHFSFLASIWMVVRLDLCLTFPAIERPEPTENDNSSSSYLSRGVDDGAQFVVPEGVELPTREGRVLKTTTVEDVKAWMADTVADNESASQSFVLAYAGEVKRAGDILTLTAPNGRVFTFDLAKYTRIIRKVKILEMTKTIIVEINRIGKVKQQLLRRFIDDLEAVHPIYVIEADSEASPRSVPNDSMFNALWQFRNFMHVAIHANVEASWDRLTRLNLPRKPARVAIIDELVDINHDDLKARLFTNPEENIDNEDTDNNGCIDDVHNCNFGLYYAQGNMLPSAVSHGTHVAGIIGAEGNNGVGVIGLSKTGAVETIPIGVALTSTSSAVSTVIQALNYAVLNNAPVSNNSYGFNQPVPSVKAALINVMKHNHLYVCAIANSYQQDASAPGIKDFPAQYALPNMLTVTSISSSGELSYFAGYSVDYVHLAAPGDAIVSTLNNQNYGLMSGTSMAAPMVAAAAGQLVAAYPTLTAPQLKRIITQSVRKLPSLKNFVNAGGMLDADRALLFGQCEVAFTEARATCKAKASESDKEKYVSAGAKPEEAEKYALHCEGTAAVLECIQTELKKTKEQACYRRTCDIAEGQCNDSRASVEIELPVMRLGESCKYGRQVDNALVMIHIKPTKASSSESAMSVVKDMLTKEVLQTNEEVVMDAVMANDGGYDVSAVVNMYSD